MDDAFLMGGNGDCPLFVGSGISMAQLVTTASYKAGDLSRINFYRGNLGGNFAGFNLTNANFFSALGVVDVTGADARGAAFFSPPGGSITTNLISPDGHIDGLDLATGQSLVVRDYDGNFAGPIPITVDQHLSMGPGGTLRMVFEADAWGSTISFAPGIPITLGGALELTFAAEVNIASQLGRTFELFDWTAVSPTGAFTISSPYAWELSNLYTTGQVTLTAIPEPSSIAFATAGLLALAIFARRNCTVQLMM